MSIQSQVQAATVTIACGAVGAEFELCKKHAEKWAQQTKNKVELFQSPNLTNDRLGLFQQIFAAKSDQIDVIQIDVIWPGLLGKHFVDLNQYVSKSTVDKHFKSIVDNNTDAQGRLLALPFFTDAGLLYYRKDLLEKYNQPVPSTWEELKKTATLIVKNEKKNNPRLLGFVWQGKAYEGLTCDALEWIDSYGGGTIIDGKTGQVTINNPKAVKALNMAASWVGTISPKGVLNYDEEASRGVFQSGNAVFMRNWPYAWPLGNSKNSPIKGKFAVAPLPKGKTKSGKHTGTLGGWNLAVSKYSKNIKAAVSLATYMASHRTQMERAPHGYNPTIASIYHNKKFIAQNPFVGKLNATFSNGVARPSKLTGRSYNKVSNRFWNAVHSVLEGRTSAEKALARLEKQLNKIRKRGWAKNK